jgi:hypothetical protein
MIDPHGEPVRENYRRQGEARERERLIKLLKEADNKEYFAWLRSNDETTFADYAEMAIGFRLAIAMIELENL